MKQFSKEFVEMKNGSLFTIPASVFRLKMRLLSLATLLLFALSASASASETPEKFSPALGIQVDTIYTHDSNVARGYDPLLSDNSLEISMRKSRILPISGHTRAVLTGLLDGDFFNKYTGLSRISGGLKGSVEYRGSAEFMAPTYSFFANVFLDQYHSDLRDGHRYSTGLSFRSPLTDRIRLYAALVNNRRKGSNPVFDDSDNSFALNLDYDVTRTGTLYLGGERRHGDIVTTINYNFIPGSAPDDSFPGMSCVKLGGETKIYTLGYNWGLGTKDSIDFSLRKISSNLDSSSMALLNNFGIWYYSYETKQYSISYLRRF